MLNILKNTKYLPDFLFSITFCFHLRERDILQRQVDKNPSNQTAHPQSQNNKHGFKSSSHHFGNFTTGIKASLRTSKMNWTQPILQWNYFMEVWERMG